MATGIVVDPMVELIARRKALKTKVTRVERNIVGLTNEVSRAYLQVQLEMVEKMEFDIMAFEDDMLLTVPADQYDAQAEECGQLVERCLIIKATIKGYLEPTLQKTFRDAGVGAHDGNRSHIGVKLPKLETPRFSGNLHEWISFRDRFVAAIHSKPDDVLKGSEKLEYLKASLSGEAADVIRSIQVSDDNYIIAWDLLTRQYENKREISRAHLERFFGQEAVKPGCGTSLRSLVNRTNECMRSLQSLGAPVEHWDIILCFVLNKKLDQETRQQWELTFHNGSFSELDDMLEFLDRRARSFAAAGSSAAPMQQQGPHVRKAKYTQDTGSFHVSTSKQCGICKGDHPAFKCKKLLDSRPAERQDLIQKSGLCFNCLASGHSSRQCNAGGCNRCGKKHNSLLHLDENTIVKKTQLNSNHVCKPTPNRTVLLATALVKNDDKFGQPNSVRALIDGGSQASFIKESCVQRLCLLREAGSMKITGVGKKTAAVTRGKVHLIVKSHFDMQFCITVEAFILPDVTGYQPFVPGKNEWEHLHGFQLADPKFYAAGEIELLLGADVKGEITRAGTIQGPVGTPAGELTAFGWIISGSIELVDTTTITVHHAHLDLESLVHRFWEVENVPDKRPFTFEEKMAEEHYSSTTQRDETGKFVVRLPFRTDKPPLGRSRDVAVRRLLQTERKLGWGTDRREKYAGNINEYFQLDHIERVPEQELIKLDDQVYYIPHHAVIKESSTTTKLRVVFDASAKMSSGISLNEKLLTGPTIQQDILSILVRARKHQIMFCADICKMYRQIWVHPEDRDFQRILWRSSATEPIQEFRLKTVTFGYASSPFQAIRSMFQLASDEEKDFPLAAKVIRRDAYVDDVISGTDSLDEAIQVQDQLMQMLARGGFPLRKWSSNSSELLSRLLS